MIRIIDRRDDVPANEEFIHLALGISRELVKKALKGLEDKELIVFRKSEGAYDFQNRIGINVENEIADCIVKHFSNYSISKRG